MNYAELNGKYLEKVEEFDKNKERLTQCEKELSELKSKLSKFDLMSKNVDELESCKKEIIKLQTENKKYKTIADEGSIAIEQVAGLQKQHEQLVKENSDLKATLFDAEGMLKSASTTGSKADEKDKKISIVEEIRLALAEVIYVYKTLDTNAKEYIMGYEIKKDKAQEYVKTIEELQRNPKKESQLDFLKTLSSDIAFLAGFQLKPENLKTILACLAAAAKKKESKLETYNIEIGKFNSMLEVSKIKVTEYEQKLSLYY